MFSKNPVIRFDETIREAANSGVPQLVNLANSIDQILQQSSGQSRARVKRDIGGKLSLGYHRQSSATITAHRHAVRGALLAQVVLRVPRAHRRSKSDLLGLDAHNLRTHVANLFLNSDKANPVITDAGECNPDFNMAGRGGLRHTISYQSSSANMSHLCYMPTREMVWVRRIRIGVNVFNNIVPYGDGANFNRVLYAPWYPTALSATDSPASPAPNLATLDHSITDNHSHSMNKALGPNVGDPPIMHPHIMFESPLVDSEMEQEQWYQYNDTGDPATWNRANVGNDAAIDPHWKNIPGGNFTLIRKLHHAASGWKLLFTKKRGLVTVGEVEVDVIDQTGAPVA